MKYSGIGGQAVIEGVMMKNGDEYATAVRKPDGEIEVKKDTYVSMGEKVKFFSLPFVRGVFSFVDSMVLGMRSLTFSASFFEDDEDAGEPGKFEQFLDRVFGEKLEKALMAVVMVFSVIMAIGIFMVLPLFLANIFHRFIASQTVMAVVEGVIRIAIFIAYIKIISHMEDIRRTFMYHGAEHKCINCLEHGLDLTVENVRKSSKEHKRCGTSFLLIVMVISILVFSIIPWQQESFTHIPVIGVMFSAMPWAIWRLILRLLLLPIVAGISYEIIKLRDGMTIGLPAL
jgi:uncharacterized protein YqhQ